MITRISRCFVQKSDRLAVQTHVFALESQVAESRHLFFPATPVILDEQRERLRRVEERPAYRQLLDLRRLRELERLCVLRCVREQGADEIEVGRVGAVLEDAEGVWCAGVGGGPDEDAVEVDLSREAATNVSP
jgi:hypothetical protein